VKNSELYIGFILVINDTTSKKKKYLVRFREWFYTIIVYDKHFKLIILNFKLRHDKLKFLN
jgi:hypothetical protein